MFYNKKALIACALIMVALPNIFMAMEKESKAESLFGAIISGKLDTAGKLVEQGAKVSKSDIEAVGRRIDNFETIIKGYERDESKKNSIPKLQSFIEKMQEFKQYLQDVFEGQQLLGKIYAASQWSEKIERYKGEIKKILDDNPALVNASISQLEYGIISPLEYAVKANTPDIAHLLIAKGAKISTSAIETINKRINVLSNDIAASESRAELLQKQPGVKAADIQSIENAHLKNRSHLSNLRDLKAYQELKSYLEDKMQEQQKIEAARIRNLQTTQPKTQSIEYLKSLGRK